MWNKLMKEVQYFFHSLQCQTHSKTARLKISAIVFVINLFNKNNNPPLVNDTGHTAVLQNLLAINHNLSSSTNAVQNNHNHHSNVTNLSKNNHTVPEWTCSKTATPTLISLPSGLRDPISQFRTRVKCQPSAANYLVLSLRDNFCGWESNSTLDGFANCCHNSGTRPTCYALSKRVVSAVHTLPKHCTSFNFRAVWRLSITEPQSTMAASTTETGSVGTSDILHVLLETDDRGA